MKLRITNAILIVAIAALAHTTTNALAQAKPGLTLSTIAFEDGGIIPNRYTAAAKGIAVSPKLTWAYVPDGTLSFVMLVHDPDTSVKKTVAEILHWMVFNIPATARELPEGIPTQAKLPDGAIQGRNYTKNVGYVGMGAPAPGPYHHYTFELFALDTRLSLGPDANQTDILKAMNGHILAKGVVVGRFHLP